MEQVQGLALVLKQGQALLGGPQQVWRDYFQPAELPGWPLLSVWSRGDNWDSPPAWEPLEEDSCVSEKTGGSCRPRPRG